MDVRAAPGRARLPTSFPALEGAAAGKVSPVQESQWRTEDSHLQLHEETVYDWILTH